MRTLIVLGLLLALAGCGGGGSSVPVVNFPAVNTSRVGTWSGRATDTVSNTSGVVLLAIDAAGAVRGTWRTDGGVSWDVSGTFEFPPSPNNITLALTAQGQMALSERGTMLVGINGDLGGTFQDLRQVQLHGPLVLLSRLTVNLQRQ